MLCLYFSFISKIFHRRQEDPRPGQEKEIRGWERLRPVLRVAIEARCVMLRKRESERKYTGLVSLHAIFFALCSSSSTAPRHTYEASTNTQSQSYSHRSPPSTAPHSHTYTAALLLTVHVISMLLNEI